MELWLKLRHNLSRPIQSRQVHSEFLFCAEDSGAAMQIVIRIQVKKKPTHSPDAWASFFF
jgi:hypothetical protein